MEAARVNKIQSARRRRAAIACTQCHTRKVRCNVDATGPPCAHCLIDEVPCILHTSSRGKYDRSRRTAISSRDERAPENACAAIRDPSVQPHPHMSEEAQRNLSPASPDSLTSIDDLESNVNAYRDAVVLPSGPEAREAFYVGKYIADS